MHRPNFGQHRPLADEAHFLKSLLANPRLTGAVAPSGRYLARAMAASVGAPAGLVVELGPGTGPVTKALIEKGVARERLVLVEHDARFCRVLAQRFHPASVIQGDAYDLKATLRDLLGKPISAIVSSLPLLNQAPHKRAKLIDDAFALMGPDGVFVQFTYGLLSPIPREACANRLSAHRGAPIWRNLPPARVWTYRLDSGAGKAEPVFARLKREADRIGEDLSHKRRQAGEALKRHRDIIKERLAKQTTTLRERSTRGRAKSTRGRAGTDERN